MLFIGCDVSSFQGIQGLTLMASSGIPAHSGQLRLLIATTVLCPYLISKSVLQRLPLIVACLQDILQPKKMPISTSGNFVRCPSSG